MKGAQSVSGTATDIETMHTEANSSGEAKLIKMCA